MIEITNEDNMALMARYPDNYFDLAIVDPEYGINASKPSIKPNTVVQSNGKILNVKQSNYLHKDWDIEPAGAAYFDELLRVSKNQIIWGVNYYKYIFPESGRIVWDKLNGTSDQFGCEIAYCSLNNRTDIVYYMWSGMMQGVYCGFDIRQAIKQQGNKKLNEKRIHPTQKPVILYKWLLMNYAQPGQIILDTHRGSGSLDIACHDMGFDLVTCEKEKDYFDDANERLKQHQSQLLIF
ncbi:MAG: DNA methyltransferase [Sulfolobaceae archaeon]